MQANRLSTLCRYSQIRLFRATLVSASNMDPTLNPPQSNGLPVTEYAADPLPSEVQSTKPKAPTLVPQEFLGPDGYPDVRKHVDFLDTSPLTH